MGRSPIWKAIAAIEQRSSNTFQIAHHIIIRDPENMIAKRHQSFRTPCVSCQIDMGVAVNFHNQPFAWTKEVGDCIANDGLSAEFIPAQL